MLSPEEKLYLLARSDAVDTMLGVSLALALSDKSESDVQHFHEAAVNALRDVSPANETLSEDDRFKVREMTIHHVDLVFDLARRIRREIKTG